MTIYCKNKLFAFLNFKVSFLYLGQNVLHLLPPSWGRALTWIKVRRGMFRWSGRLSCSVAFWLKSLLFSATIYHMAFVRGFRLFTQALHTNPDLWHARAFMSGALTFALILCKSEDENNNRMIIEWGIKLHKFCCDLKSYLLRANQIFVT